MDTLNASFQQAAGFSGTSLSLFIRTTIFFLSVVWGALIVKGMLSEMHTSEDPMQWFIKLVLLLMLLGALWVIVY